MQRLTPLHCPQPSSFNLDNYKAALQYAPILKYFMNSVLIVGISVLVTVALVAMCAYVISRFDFKLKTLIVLLISASLMLPAQAISQPLFAIFQKLGIFDTKLGLIIVYSAMGIPMSFFVMVSYYKTISTALEESAYIDGATFIPDIFTYYPAAGEAGTCDHCHDSVYQYLE
ncbi:MAG: carbohydrate ABC transporter permease [Blautia faecis]